MVLAGSGSNYLFISINRKKICAFISTIRRSPGPCVISTIYITAKETKHTIDFVTLPNKRTVWLIFIIKLPVHRHVLFWLIQWLPCTFHWCGWNTPLLHDLKHTFISTIYSVHFSDIWRCQFPVGGVKFSTCWRSFPYIRQKMIWSQNAQWSALGNYNCWEY